MGLARKKGVELSWQALYFYWLNGVSSNFNVQLNEAKFVVFCGKKDCPNSERRIPDKWNKINYKKNLFQNKIVRKLELRISESPLYLIHNTVKVSHVHVLTFSYLIVILVFADKKKTVHKFTTDLTTNDAWRRMHARNKKSIAQDHPIHLSFFKLNINVTLY